MPLRNTGQFGTDTEDTEDQTEFGKQRGSHEEIPPHEIMKSVNLFPINSGYNSDSQSYNPEDGQKKLLINIQKNNNNQILKTEASDEKIRKPKSRSPLLRPLRDMKSSPGLQQKSSVGGPKYMQPLKQTMGSTVFNNEITQITAQKQEGERMLKVPASKNLTFGKMKGLGPVNIGTSGWNLAKMKKERMM